MVRCKVLRDFADKFDNNIVYTVGAVLEFDDDRAASAVASGLVEVIEVKKPAAKKRSKKED